MTETSAAPVKLPILGTATATYRLIFGNLGFLARHGLPWLVLAVALLVGLDWVKYHFSDRIGSSGFSWRDLIAVLLDSVVQAACLAPFAVRWHRHILHSAGDLGVPISPLILTYAIAALLIEVVFYAILWLPLSLLPAEASDNPLLSTLLVGIFIALLIAGIYVWGRAMLILPAIALGRDRTFQAAWRASRRNGWRLFWSSLMAFVMPIIAWVIFYLGKFVVQLLGRHDNSETEQTATPPATTSPVWDFLGTIETTIFWMLLALLAISFLSVAYRELVLKREVIS